MDHIFKTIQIVFLLCFYWNGIETKYMEGELRSSEVCIKKNAIYISYGELFFV